MAEYYTKSESDAKYAATSHTHALETMGGNELPANRVAISDAASPLFEDAYTLDEALFSVADQLAGKAAFDHTHENLSVTPVAHTHAQSEVTGLEARLTEIEADIADLQSSGGGSAEVTPMVVCSMHLGKLDNNSGAEVTSASRICSEPFAIESGKSYWQVNDKGVNMYVLIYDADEMFLAYLGNIASGAEIEVNTPNAAYMRISSLVGEYDLTNEFRIYDVDPASGSGGGTAVGGFTQEEADLLYAPISHTHDGYAAAEHTHDGFAATAHTHTAADITGLPSSVDAYSKTEADARFAQASHIHGEYLTEDEAVDAFAGVNHTHTASEITGLPSSVDAYSKTESDAKYAPVDHAHTGYATTAALTSAVENVNDELRLMTEVIDSKADTTHYHSEYASANDLSGKADAGHTHTASQVGAAAASHTHTYSEVGAASSSHTHTPASIGAAASSHTHTGYASSTHTHDYAASNHTHSGYASSNHSHSGYASSSHSHTAANVGALPSSGGTVSGDLTVTGTFISNGVANTQSIQPKDSGSYSIGTSDKRYYSTYLKVNPNVSSDRRCKRDIAIMDVDALAAFVDKLPVVSYNYNDDAADEVKRIGLIAQDVVAADSEIAKGCIEQDEKGFYSLRAADLVFPLIAAVQALTKRVEELEGK